MTGAVTFEQLTWIIGVITVAGAAVAVFLFWVWRIVTGLKRDFAQELQARDAAMVQRDAVAQGQLREAAMTAQLEKERAKMVEQELRQALSEYQVHAAEKYATKDGVAAAVSRMEASIERLTTQVHDAVERITSRMDRILDVRE